MDGSFQTIFTVVFTFLFFLIQRAEQKHRRMVTLLIAFFICPLMALFAVTSELIGETLYGFGIGAVLNVLFWIVIGRYNPVRSSDETIQVLGMDD